MPAYYNEFDKQKAAWLRELIAAGHIAPGDVDERSIKEVQADDLRRYTQCHFFAGIGVWSYALRQAGWRDDRPVWTGSCPCQGFSVAGKRLGFADERHLWPDWFKLIAECRPDVIFGEEVAKKDGLAWLDLVQSDLEASDYAIGAAVIPACGFGAPHLRERLYFVADARYEHGGSRNRTIEGTQEANRQGDYAQIVGGCEVGNLGNLGNLGNASSAGLARRSRQSTDDGPGQPSVERTGSPVNGFWSDAEWIYCRDEKYRAVEPGTFPLANGASERVGRLRGYGDAIVAEVAKGFIEAYMETERNCPE